MGENEPRDAFEEFQEAYTELAKALSKFAEELAKTIADILSALLPRFNERRQRRAKVKQLRREFVRKRGLRR